MGRKLKTLGVSPIRDPFKKSRKKRSKTKSVNLSDDVRQLRLFEGGEQCKNTR